jgi:hypothetical protein
LFCGRLRDEHGGQNLTTTGNRKSRADHASFLNGDIQAHPEDPYYGLNEGFADLSPKERLGRFVLLVRSRIPDITAEELAAAEEVIRQGIEFDVWVLGQLIEIRERHPGPGDETIEDLLNRAVAAGDDQAKKLIDMDILDTRMSSIATRS